jgi:predicted Rossmann fold nucleotide-binding protein DprA/Smf involved in DNA uptake
MIEDPLLSFWSLEGGTQGVGNASLLDQPLTAFFASRQCPGVAIRAAMAWAVEQARSKSPIISGFHSPLEQSVLEVMLAAGAPCVMVIARKLEQAHIPPAWLRAVQSGTAAVISMDDTTRRLTTELAVRRNDWVAYHANRIVVAHASAGGNLLRQVMQWENEGRNVDYLAN